MLILDKYDRLIRRSLRLQGVKSRVERVAGRRLHFYEAEGKGPGPALLLLHGLGGNANTFAPIIPGLRHGWRRVYALDLPGHGFSELESGKPLLNVRGNGEVAYAFMKEIIREPVGLVGNSMGGAIALGIAVEKADEVRAVGLLAPAGAPLTADDIAALRGRFNPRSRRDVIAFVRCLTHRRILTATLVTSDIAELLRSPAPQHILAQASPDERLDEAALRRLPMPIALVWGASEKVLPPRGLEYFRTHLPPGTRVEVFERCGHVPQMEQTGRTLRVLRDLGARAAHWRVGIENVIARAG